MKHNIVTKSDAFPKYDQNALCGIIDGSKSVSKSSTVSETVPLSDAKSKWSTFRLNSISKWEAFPKWLGDVELNSTKPKNVAQSGVSTRYWDCCKVAHILCSFCNFSKY